jgi:hypothetical protein
MGSGEIVDDLHGQIPELVEQRPWRSRTTRSGPAAADPGRGRTRRGLSPTSAAPEARWPDGAPGRSEIDEDEVTVLTGSCDENRKRRRVWR